MFKDREFWEWMQQKGTFRERILSTILNKIVASALGLGGIIFVFRLIMWAVKRSVTIDRQNDVVVTSWIGYVLTGVIVVSAAVMALSLFYVSFVKESHKKKSEERGALGDLLTRNVQKILNVAPSIEITYDLDQRSYTIDNAGRDKIKTSFKIAKTEKPVTLVPIKHYSTESYKTPFLLNVRLIGCQGHAIDLPACNLEREKEWLIFFNPPIENTGGFEYEFEWPNFFGDLRTKGSDYVAYLAQQKTTKAVIEIQSPATEWLLDWEFGMTAPDGGALQRSQDGRLLTISLNNPCVGREYRFGFRKLT